MNLRDEDALTRDNRDLFTRHWRVPWHAHAVPLLIAITIVAVAVSRSPLELQTWALSIPGMHAYGPSIFFLYLIAHGGLVHAALNAVALLFVSGAVISRLGAPPLSWVRYLYIFIGSGVSGGILFLLLRNDAGASVIGASGAIFGLFGALARVHPSTGTIVPIRSVRTWLVAEFFIQNHLVLFAIICVVGMVTQHPVGLAWEAHLGGLLFGFFATPAFLPEPRRVVPG